MAVERVCAAVCRACRVRLGREWLVSVQDCVRGASDEDGGGYVTSPNREPHDPGTVTYIYDPNF